MTTKRVLTGANRELFRRADDERFDSLSSLLTHCVAEKERSADRWLPPREMIPEARNGGLLLPVGGGNSFGMTDWSFGQLCQLSGVDRRTVNRLSAETASQVFSETLPSGNKPLQVFTQGETVRSVHGVGYTRLHNADVVAMLKEFAVDFTPPQKAAAGGTGLYCGEQDLFTFLIDPTGWAEIDGETFAPGFFVWNSEVGKRSVGIQTFWFQAVCANHIVWDAVEVVDFSRKHTASVGDALTDIRRHVEQLVAKRDERRDGFVTAVRKAMGTSLGADAEEALKVLAKHGIPKGLAKEALKLAEQNGRFTIFAVVDALTRLSQKIVYAGERTDADLKAAGLLQLALAA